MEKEKKGQEHHCNSLLTKTSQWLGPHMNPHLTLTCMHVNTKLFALNRTIRFHERCCSHLVGQRFVEVETIESSEVAKDFLE